MQLGLRPDPDLEPKRAKTLLISIGLHLVILLILVLKPDMFSSVPKRTIRIAGQEYDLSKHQLTELMLPPEPRPRPPVDNRPLTAPPPQPNPAIPQPPPPPPPPPPQQREMTITPEDVIAEGAKPDGQVQASRGNTQEMARAGDGGNGEPAKPAQPKEEPSKLEPPRQMAQNTNPNALRLGNLMDSANRIIQQSIDDDRRASPGGRTGIQQPGLPQPNFATEQATIISDTKGYDFGPYMNQVVNRVRYNWYSLIPEVARPPFAKRGRVIIIFTIQENGTVTDLRVAANSGTDPLDRAAVGSITASNPFPKLPSNFDGDNIVLQFTFLYNYPR